jgi:hypothetical protein
MSDRAQLRLILACVLCALALVGVQVFRASGTRRYAPGATFAERSRLAEFAANGVRVLVSSESDTQGRPLLRATFIPTEGGFHLYRKDLDTNTTDGAGVATRLELLPNSSVKTAGPPFADVVAHPAKESDRGVEIYPDGPVNLRLPIQFVGAATNIAAKVAVSYMACKTDDVCLQAVEGQILDIQLVSK